MSKITIQNYHDCYEYGKKIVNGEMERKEAINTLYQKGKNNLPSIETLYEEFSEIL